MIFAGQGSDFEAQTPILEDRGAIVTISLKMMILDEKNEFDNPPPGSAKIVILQSLEMAVFLRFLMSVFLVI